MLLIGSGKDYKMKDCLFCRIVAGEIPSTKVWEDEVCYAFRDINPQAKCHVVLVPKAHVTDICDGADKLDDAVLGHMIRTVRDIARQEGLGEGFRVISNCGKHGCQSVGHWHIHILGGDQLSEKMA